MTPGSHSGGSGSSGCADIPGQQHLTDSPLLADDVRNRRGHLSPCRSSCDDDHDDNDGDAAIADGRSPAVSSASSLVKQWSWGNLGDIPRVLSLKARALSLAVKEEVYGKKTKQKSLLAEPRIRLLLFIYGLYMVSC